MKLEYLKRFWFLSSLVIVLVLAYLTPNIGKTGGIIRPEYTIKYISASIIFFFTGYSIKTQVRNSMINSDYLLNFDDYRIYKEL
jgi:sodium/bile acid cotransporter 7